jgi:AmmeMemoRadiSam system protein A
MKVTAEQGRVLLGWARAELRRRLGAAATPRPSGAWCEVPGASFVTLRWAVDGRLQGCIGSTEPHVPIVDDVGHNAVAAGLYDPRADPLVQRDVEALDVELSILSPLEPIAFTDRASACNAVRVGVDGIVFSSGRQRATLLPSMWDRLPTPDVFLSALLQKAGRPPGAWPDDTRLWRFIVDKHVDMAPRRTASP